MGRATRRLTFHLIPHTHWDREWYRPRAGFQAALVPVLDAVLAQLEADPDARFVLDGQTILLEDYLAVRPDAASRIAPLVRRGQLELGPWYVLSDLLIPGGASLRRNLSEGARDAAAFGGRLAVLYSPDAFGHPAELPDLAREAELRHAVIRRGVGRPGRVDRDLWQWESERGNRLLLHHLPAGGYDMAIDLTHVGDDLAARWQAVRRELVERAAGTQIAVFLGADHHAMAADVSGLAARIRRLEPEHAVRISGLMEYFGAVEGDRADLPSLEGELRRGDGHAWLLQDVHASRARMRRRHGREELLLSRVAEPLSELAQAGGGPDQSALIRKAWRTLLECQFHDTLAGTTSDAVQQEQLVRLRVVAEISRAVIRASIVTLAGFDEDRARERPAQWPGRLAEWNPGAHRRGGIRTAELLCFRRDVLVGTPTGRSARQGSGWRPSCLRTLDGSRIPVQVLDVRRGMHRDEAPRHYPDQDEVDRVWVAYDGGEVAAGAVRALFVEPGAEVPAAQELTARIGVLANRFVEARVSSRGAIAVRDKRTGARFGGMCVLVDEADAGDLYTFSRGRGPAVRSGRAQAQRVFSPGPLIGAVETRWSMRSAGTGTLGIRQIVSLHADAPIIRIRLDIDNRATDHRLRAAFRPAGGAGVLTGTALGFARRGLTPSRPAPHALEAEPSSAPAHRYLASGNADSGYAILMPGFFEFGWRANREMSISLFRSVGELSREGLPERPGHAAWPLATPDAQEPGHHLVELAIAPLTGSEADDPARLEALWEEAWLPMQSWWLGAPVG